MPIESWVTIGLSIIGGMSAWYIWATLSIFRLDKDTSNIKNDIEILLRVKELIVEIRNEMIEQRKKH